MRFINTDHRLARLTRRLRIQEHTLEDKLQVHEQSLRRFLEKWSGR
ncbi:MAG: hypothetical protein ACFB50_10915 [Rubrobacteraceae bacterium]